MEEETKKEKVIQNIDHLNKAIPTPMPSKVNDLDVDGTFYQTIIEGAESGTLDLNQIDSLTNVSRTRDNVYNLLDMMGEDPIISSALNIYASDVCEPNDKGQIVWAVSDDDRCLHCVSEIIDSLSLDKNMFSWVYSLVKYGDLYLRLYRNSEYNEDVLKLKNLKKDKDQLNESKEKLDENIIVKAYSKNDHYASYMEMIKNPAEVFNLTKFGKTCGYIRTHILPGRLNNTNDVLQTRQEYQFLYQFNQQDVDVFEATEIVHASLEDNSDRTEEEISLLNTNVENGEQTELRYHVKRGQSILYNSFKIWRELQLLENAVLLNRLTQSSVVRSVNVEVGDMDKVEARAVVARVKQMIEQKSAINTGTSLSEYTNPGPIQNTIYIPTHEGVGNVSVNQIGGDTQVGDLTDLNYWKNKLYGSLSIPKQYLGDTEDSTGFNGGTSLSLISSRYAKTIKRIQNAVIQAVTDGINLILLDRGLVQYINKFQVKMQVPETQEEKDRKEGMNNSIATIQNIMGLLDGIEHPKTKLEILKTLLAEVVNDSEVINLLQDEIDRLQGNEEFNLEGGDGSFDTEFGGGGPTDLGGGDESEPLDAEDENGEPFEGEEENNNEEPSAEVETENPAEAFYNNKGGERLNEKGDLPSFADLGISYTQVR